MLLDIIFKNRIIFWFASRLYYIRGIRHLREQKLISKYLVKKLNWADNSYIESAVNPHVQKNKTIWVVWMQGIGNAPKMVQKCYQSILMYKEDYNVILLTKDNIDQYVKLPQHIENLYKERKMSEAHHSDMVRLYLLIYYGGIWCDATCFRNAPFPEYIKNTSFFMFSADKLTSSTQSIICSNWFIKSEFGNPLLIKTYNVLCEYNKRYSKPHNYYIFHLVLSNLVKNDEECKRIWDSKPYICNMNPHAFYFGWDMPYNKNRYQHLLSSCFIHKLTYKFPSTLLEKSEEGSETIFQYFYEHDT